MHLIKKDAVSVNLGFKLTEIIGGSLLFGGLGVAGIVKSAMFGINGTLFLLCLGVLNLISGAFAWYYLSRAKMEADSMGIRWFLPEPRKNNDLAWDDLSQVRVCRKRSRKRITPKVTFLMLDCKDGRSLKLPLNLDTLEEGELFLEFIGRHVKVIDYREV